MSESLPAGKEIVVSPDQYKNLLSQVVQVMAHGQEPNVMLPFLPSPPRSGRGTAFFIPTPDNSLPQLLTCAHVVENADPLNGVRIVIPGRTRDPIPVRVKHLLPDIDLAVLEMIQPQAPGASMHKPLPLGNDIYLPMPAAVTVIGYPLGMDKIKVLQCTYNGRQMGLQVDGAINPGNSGGPVLFNDRVVGVIGSGINPMMASNVSFAVPISFYLAAKPAIDAPDAPLIIRKRSLGIIYQNVGADMLKAMGSGCKTGVILQWLAKASPLREVGFRKGDLFCSIRTAKHSFDIDNKGDVKVDWHLERLPFTEVLNRVPYDDSIIVSGWSVKNSKPLSGTIKLANVGSGALVRHFPAYEKIENETIAGVVVSDLAANHLMAFPPLLFRMTPDDREKEHVIITAVLPGGQVSDLQALNAGTLLKRVNGRPVTTVAEYREALRKPLSGTDKKLYILWETDNDELVIVSLDSVLKQEKVLAEQNAYKESSLLSDLRKLVTERA